MMLFTNQNVTSYKATNKQLWIGQKSDVTTVAIATMTIQMTNILAFNTFYFMKINSVTTIFYFTFYSTMNIFL